MRYYKTHISSIPGAPFTPFATRVGGIDAGSPFDPVIPRRPGGPISPTKPGLPSRPSFPGSPGLPVSPLKPGAPKEQRLG